jgi:hypothetical protein
VVVLTQTLVAKDLLNASGENEQITLALAKNPPLYKITADKHEESVDIIQKKAVIYIDFTSDINNKIIKYLPTSTCKHFQLSLISGLASTWGAIMTRRNNSRLIEKLNYAIAQRMSYYDTRRVQIAPECKAHFYPSDSQASTEVGYSPLSIAQLAGTFVVFTGLCTQLNGANISHHSEYQLLYFLKNFFNHTLAPVISLLSTAVLGAEMKFSKIHTKSDLDAGNCRRSSNTTLNIQVPLIRKNADGIRKWKRQLEHLTDILERQIDGIETADFCLQVTTNSQAKMLEDKLRRVFVE